MGWGRGGGGNGECERRIIKVFVKIKNKIRGVWLGGGGGGVAGWGGGVRMDLNEEMKFFVKIQKKKIGRGWSGQGGVRVDLNKELKFL